MMDKSQAIYNLWSQFGLPVYDENTVPDDAVFPFITYSTALNSLGNVVSLSASLWYHSTSWQEASQKAEEIAEYIGKYGHKSIPIDGGYFFVTKGSPFAQRMSDEGDRQIRRIYILLEAEFLTAY